MELAIVLAGIAIMLALVWRAARDAISVCVIDVKNGRAKVRRGGIAPRILADIGDVVRRPPIARATIRIVRDAGRAQMKMTGDASDAQRQQLRNVIGSVPLAKLVNARRR